MAEDLSFLGYNAAPNALESSNSNTPGVIDPTNPDPEGPYYRVAANLDSIGSWTFTDSNAYSGDNGRAVMLDNDSGLVLRGRQFQQRDRDGSPGRGRRGGSGVLHRRSLPQSAQTPGAPTPLGSFSITSVPPNTKPDKAGKDTNFRGLTVYNDVVYYTKGSRLATGSTPSTSSNTSGVHAPTVRRCRIRPSPCPPGVLTRRAAECASSGVQHDAGQEDHQRLPVRAVVRQPDHAVRGRRRRWQHLPSDTNPYDDAAAQTMAGLQKWTFNGAAWQLAYTLQAGLNLGQPYTVARLPDGDQRRRHRRPVGAATDGLRNITGQVNRDGTATIWAVDLDGQRLRRPGRRSPTRWSRSPTDAERASLPSNESFSTIVGADQAGSLPRGAVCRPTTVRTTVASSLRSDRGAPNARSAPPSGAGGVAHARAGAAVRRAGGSSSSGRRTTISPGALSSSQATSSGSKPWPAVAAAAITIRSKRSCAIVWRSAWR